MKSRKIIHVDMDCYFAAVEMRETPSYVGKPLAVGGSADRRGVIATCNYEARKFGIHSAMSTAQALKLCPDLILAKGNMSLYKTISQHIRQIFLRYTDKIEPLSLDEAYLDVTDCTLYQGSATLIAQAIRADIFQETKLTASAGVATNKFIAKIASDENKPNGICVVAPHQVTQFVDKLPLKKINGVGRVTLAKLNQLGLYTAADVRAKPKAELIQRLGSFAVILIERCHGIDHRSVVTERVRKSIGVEHTLARDISSYAESDAVFKQLFDELMVRVHKNKAQHQVNKIGVKLKFSDFQQTTLECSKLSFEATNMTSLLQTAWARSQGRAVRLIGLNVGLNDGEHLTISKQLSLNF